MKQINTSDRLSLIRGLMVKHQVQAYIVTSEDSHFNEYVHPHHERRAFISGFQGSSGIAVITLRYAALWTDGRYFEEALKCLNDQWLLMKQGIDGVLTIEEWLNEVLEAGDRIGFDPSTAAHSFCQRLKKECPKLSLSPIVSVNLVDEVWNTMSSGMETEELFLIPRPKLEFNKIRPMRLEFCGKDVDKKIEEIRTFLFQEKFPMLITVQLDELNWLFNARGSDIPSTNTFFGYSIITPDKVYLFVHGKALEKSQDFILHIKCLKTKVLIQNYSEFQSVYLELLNKLPDSSHMLFSPSDNEFIVGMASRCRKSFRHSPIQMMKAQKNECELKSSIIGHLLDSVILCEFFSWLENISRQKSHSKSDQIVEISPEELPHLLRNRGKYSGSGTILLTEHILTTILNECRASTATNLGPSFSTIISFESNSSIIHYHAPACDSKPLKYNSTVLCDSGGQYEALCTTDITRTIALSPDFPYCQEFLEDFNLVLKSHVYLAHMKFPYNIAGSKLDTIARHIYWFESKNFQHGTGHGVGSALCVHEGPIGLSGSRLKQFSDFGLTEPGIKENMILTIEPGFYKEGYYGIRIENCYYTAKTGEHEEFLQFVPLTLVPFQRMLIKADKLSPNERKWINDYHSRVYNEILNAKETLGPILDFEMSLSMLEWLKVQTSPI